VIQLLEKQKGFWTYCALHTRWKVRPNFKSTRSSMTKLLLPHYHCY